MPGTSHVCSLVPPGLVVGRGELTDAARAPIEPHCLVADVVGGAGITGR